MADWWEAAPLVSPASDPAFTGYIPGRPKPTAPKPPVFVPQGATQMYDPNTGAYLPVPQAGKDEKDQLKEAIDGLGVDELLSSIGRARDKIKTGWATGAWGALAELKPGGGTPRDDFLGQLESIQGGIIMEKLAALKELSKTGASGLGALSEKEGQRLASSVGALRDDMSPEAYEQSFRTIAKHALTLKAIKDGLDPRTAEVAKQINAQAESYASIKADEKNELAAPAPAAGGKPPLGDAPPGGVSPDDITFGPDSRPEGLKIRDQLQARVERGDNIDDLNTWLSSVGRQPLSPADAAAIKKARAKGSGITVKAPVDASLSKKEAEKVQAGVDRYDNPLGAAVLGAGDAVTLGAQDQIVSALSAFGGAMRGEGAVGDLYDRNMMMANEFEGEVASRHLPSYVGGQLVGGVASMALGGGALRGTGLARAATDRLGRAGAAVASDTGVGALYGFNADDENRGRGIITGGAGGAAGGALGQYAVAPLVSRATDRIAMRGGRGLAPELAAAADAENVSLIRPMVEPRLRGKMAALESNPASQGTIRGGIERVTGEIEEGVGRLGAGGRQLEPGAAGEVLQTSGNRYITRTRGIANRLYSRAERLGGDTSFLPENAIRQANEELATLGANPETNRAEMTFLEGLRADLSQPKTIAQLRDLRTSIRGRIGTDNLTMTQAEARAVRILDAAADDIERAVPQAAPAYRRADAFYRERQTIVNDIKQSILGKRGDPMDPQKAFANIKTLTAPGANGRRLGAIMRHLEPDERNDIAATVAQALGRDSVDGPFSPARFLSQTKSDKFSPSALRTIFGPDGAQSIANLRTVARALNEAGGDINRSRTSGSLIRNSAKQFVATITGMGGGAVTIGGGGGALAGAAAAGVALGANAGLKVLSARALMNPRVSRWLAQAAEVQSPAQAREASRKLGVIIGREPAVAGELQPLYDFLQQRLTTPLAAEPTANGGDNEQ